LIQILILCPFYCRIKKQKNNSKNLHFFSHFLIFSNDCMIALFKRATKRVIAQSLFWKEQLHNRSFEKSNCTIPFLKRATKRVMKSDKKRDRMNALLKEQKRSISQSLLWKKQKCLMSRSSNIQICNFLTLFYYITLKTDFKRFCSMVIFGKLRNYLLLWTA